MAGIFGQAPARSGREIRTDPTPSAAGLMRQATAGRVEESSFHRTSHRPSKGISSDR